MTPTELLLPELYRRTPEDAELQRVLAWMMARVEQDKDFTLEQLFPSTASGWGLELWERAWGIPLDRTQSDQQRRARILAKVKGTGTTTLEGSSGRSPRAFPPTGPRWWRRRSCIASSSGIWAPSAEVAHKEDLIAAVNELKPAHLDWEIKYKQTQDSPIYVGAFPRQGDTMILWEVDCKHDT